LKIYSNRDTNNTIYKTFWAYDQVRMPSKLPSYSKTTVDMEYFVKLDGLLILTDPKTLVFNFSILDN